MTRTHLKNISVRDIGQSRAEARSKSEGVPKGTPRMKRHRFRPDWPYPLGFREDCALASLRLLAGARSASSLCLASTQSSRERGRAIFEMGSKPRTIVLAGYGLNCEDETKFAFDTAGAKADIVHINDLVSAKKILRRYQILAIPGGFSYGDDTGSGKAYANKLKNHLQEELQKFIAGDRLMIGICNGFQILTNLGVLPGALLPNDSARYLDRWVDLKISGKSPWTEGIHALSLPIAHGEGKYYADGKILSALKRGHGTAATYAKGEVCAYQDLPANPNGAMQNIAAVTAREGRVLGMMPHPERAMFFTQLPHWPYLKEKLVREGKPLPEEGPGLEIFKNAVRYFTS